MKNYNYDVLSGMVGQDVQLTDDEGMNVKLKVTRVEKGALDGDEWESFCVTFEGDSGFHVPQGTFTFFNENFGDVALFVSPNSETEYETVVTRKKGEE